MPRPRLDVIADEIARCRACPRLVSWREEVARVRRRAYAGALGVPNVTDTVAKSQLNDAKERIKKL